MRTAFAAAALAALLYCQRTHAEYNWNDAQQYLSPDLCDNQCSADQTSGWDWKNVPAGILNSYDGMTFSGFECQNSFNEGGDTSLHKRSQWTSKCIVGKATLDDASCPKISSLNKNFSIASIQVSVGKSSNLTFEYVMPDGSVCRQYSDCSTDGTTVRNEQCGGAKEVMIKGDCTFGFHEIVFDCSPSPPPQTSSRTFTVTTTPTMTIPTSTLTSTPMTTAATISISTSITTPISTTKSTTMTTLTTISNSIFTTSTSASTLNSTMMTTSASTTTSTPATILNSTVMISTSASTLNSTMVTTSAPTTIPTLTTTQTSTPINTSTSTVTTASTSISILPTCGALLGNGSCAYLTSTVETLTISSLSLTTGTETSTDSISNYSTATSMSVLFPNSTTTNSTSTSTTGVSVNSLLPTPEAPCPSILPRCFSTWLSQAGSCSSNSDVSCLCPSTDFISAVQGCVTAWGLDDSEIQAALSYLVGICADFVPQNPGICTGIPASITLVPTPGAPTTSLSNVTSAAPSTTIVFTQKLATAVVTQTLTVPQVSFSTITQQMSITGSNPSLAPPGSTRLVGLVPASQGPTGMTGISDEATAMSSTLADSMTTAGVSGISSYTSASKQGGISITTFTGAGPSNKAFDIGKYIVPVLIFGI